MRSEIDAAAADRRGTIRVCRTESGAALVELAITLPLLAVVLIGTLDFGRAFRMAMIVTNAARAGAQYGGHSLTRSADTAGMEAARDEVFSANDITPDAVPTPVRTCECVNDTAGSSGVVACSTTCATGDHLVVSVTVTAAATFTMASPLPGLSSSFPITRTATMRVNY
ncbi:MAG: TadE/TadG family type IV pilus assembly protein [Vicinamibacterales bacterium]